MNTRFFIIFFSFSSLLFFSACNNITQPSLMNLQSQGTGPDEFLVLPTGPLTQPKNYSKLPLPTPGGKNRTDLNPGGDIITALGGDKNLTSKDPKLVKYVSRFGGITDIRSVLASDDLQYRKENDGLFLERLLKVNIYFKAYKKYSLDQYAEVERLRKLGVKTVSVPPRPKE